MTIYFLFGHVAKTSLTFLNDLNAKHNSIKFEYKISQSGILFLDTEVYIKNKLHKNSYRKETDRQNFLHINSEPSISLKNSIPYVQVLRVKRTCSEIENYKLYCSEFEQKFIEKGYKSDLLNLHISTVEKLYK